MGAGSALPGEMDVVVVHSGEVRSLENSAYAERAAECRAAEALVGLLASRHPRRRRRDRRPDPAPPGTHVVTENERVDAFADALVDDLSSTQGVVGARLTGAGFGGCVVALVEGGTAIELPNRAWLVRPAAGASVTSGEGDPASSPGTPARR